MGPDDSVSVVAGEGQRYSSGLSGVGGGLMAKVQKIRDDLGIEATRPKDVIAEANKQLDITPHGGLPAQADAILEQLYM